MSDQQVQTLSDSLPHPTRTVELAADFLASMVDADMGTRNGRTALYWHLVHVIQLHAKPRIDEAKQS